MCASWTSSPPSHPPVVWIRICPFHRDLSSIYRDHSWVLCVLSLDLCPVRDQGMGRTDVARQTCDCFLRRRVSHAMAGAEGCVWRCRGRGREQTGVWQVQEDHLPPKETCRTRVLAKEDADRTDRTKRTPWWCANAARMVREADVEKRCERGPACRKLFVGGLSWETTEGEQSTAETLVPARNAR